MASVSRNYFNSEGYPDPTSYEAFRNIDQQIRASGRSLNYRPLVYICSPYAGQIEKNIENARKYSRIAADRGFLPVAPHLLFPQFLDDSLEEDRQLGMFMGLVLLTKCAEIWVFGSEVTDGMSAEIDKAIQRDMPVRHFTESGKEVCA